MKKSKNLFIAVSPVIVLVVLLTISIKFVFKDAALDGAVQLSLLFSGAFAALILWFKGMKWKEFELGIVQSISVALPSILILLLIGAVAGTWLISGIIPTLVYYGLDIINPQFFLVASCISCSVVSLITGTSYATIATIGVAIMGIGTVFGINEGLVAGAVISGAYFGDKLSPLSDTTNLAPTVSGSSLFTHIRFMLWTTVPSITISLLIFLVIGAYSSQSSVPLEEIHFIQDGIKEHFTISAWLFLVPIATFVLIIKKVATIPALLISTLLASFTAIFFQPDIIKLVSSSHDSFWDHFAVLYQAIYGSIEIPTQIPALESLFSTSGMYGMLNTIWLILCAMIFGGIMEVSGFLNTITSSLIKLAKSTSALISTTALSSIVVNLVAADQYISIILPGKMFAKSYQEKNVKPEALSRTLEDAGTVTSVLIPWNTCGITQATVLGVATWTYAPYCFFCLLSPIVTVLFSVFYKKQLEN